MNEYLQEVSRSLVSEMKSKQVCNNFGLQVRDNSYFNEYSIGEKNNLQ
jgi:hypothetical protein